MNPPTGSGRLAYDVGLAHRRDPAHPSALAMFQAAVSANAERPLLHYHGATLSFQAADELSDALAAALADRGVARGDRVALYLQNGPHYVISLLAVWKLAAIAVACNPMLRGRELEDELRDAGATVLIALRSLFVAHARAVLPATAVRHVVTTSELDFAGDDATFELSGSERSCPADTSDMVELIEETAGHTVPSSDLRPTDVAVLTYTSGTTGPPKGAMNTHANVVFSSEVFRRWLHMGPEDVIVGMAPLFHVTGLVAHVGLAFAAGAPMILMHRFDAAATCRSIQRYRATTTVAPITAYLALLASPASSHCDLSSLRKAYTGGAPIPAAAVERFRRHTGLTLRSAYGLTETTSPTHLTPLGRHAPVDPDSGALAVGVPVFGTSVRILGEDGHGLGPGAIGEIAVRGPQVVPGYWGKPEESASAIRDGELRTGDVGKVDADGWLYVIDRSKDLIIASGYKIWPREVEDVLYGHEAVHEAAVVGVPDAYRGETVHAFVTLKPDAKADSADLIEHCRRELAAYKRPAVVTVLDELPKTASGKILRRTLRDRHPAGCPAAPEAGATIDTVRD